MICAAISNPSAEYCRNLLGEVEMAEIRLDLAKYPSSEYASIFGHETPTIATCRPDELGLDEQYRLLKAAIEQGANYVDIEIEAPEKQLQRILEVARANDCKVIISYHNYTNTPSEEELDDIITTCFEKGADIAKLAVMANDTWDVSRVLGLYQTDKPLVALAMGEFGKLSRIAAPLLGAPFTFAAPTDGHPTAPGQVSYNDMTELLEKLQTI